MAILHVKLITGETYRFRMRCLRTARHTATLLKAGIVYAYATRYHGEGTETRAW